MAADPLSLLKQSRQASNGQVAAPQPKQQAAPVNVPSVPKVASTPPPAPTPKVNIPAPTANPHGQFMSGNFLQKGLDVLLSPYYGISGFLKGAQNVQNQQRVKAGIPTDNTIGELAQKGKLGVTPPSEFVERVKGGFQNILPGIQNRTQIGREEGDLNAGAYLTRNPAGQSAFNFTASLGAPSLPIGKIAGPVAKLVGKAGEVAGKIPGVASVASKGLDLASKIGTGIADFAKSTPAVYKTLEKVPGLETFRNPEVGQILKAAQEQTGSRVSKLFNEINDIAKGLSKEERIAVGHAIESKVPIASPRIQVRANYIRQLSDQIGKELVDSGIMKPETFAKYKGQYLSHIADTVRNTMGPNLAGSGPLKFFTNALKERKGVLGSEGNPDYIREFQFPTFKSLAGEIHTSESVKAMKEIAQKTGQAGMKFAKQFGGPRVSQEGLVALEDLVPQRIGRLFKGVGVPQEVADYVTRTYGKANPNILESAANKALDFWKLGKTVYSGPAYHVRNALSNLILSDFSTGEGLPATVYNYGKAVKAYLGQGEPKLMQYLQEMKDAGVINRVNVAEGVEKLKPEMFGQGENLLKKIIASPKLFQNANEETAKLNVYRFWRDKGASVGDAAKKAEEAIFSPYRISQAERGLVKNIIPFYSFARQALPFTVKTAVKNPERITKYEKAKTAVEGLSPEGASNNTKLPDNMQGNVRLPVKDKQGNYSYFDPTYILPYGNFGESGKGLPFGLSVNPLIGEAAQQAFNKDTYFDQPIAKSAVPGRANAQRAQHAFQTFAPNIMPTDFFGGIPTGQPGMTLKTRGGSKLYDAFTESPDYAGRTRSKVQAVLDTLGLKSAVFNPEEQAKFDSLDKSKQLKAIESELRTTLRDQRLSLEERKQIIQQLRDVQQQIISAP